MNQSIFRELQPGDKVALLRAKRTLLDDLNLEKEVKEKLKEYSTDGEVLIALNNEKNTIAVIRPEKNGLFSKRLPKFERDYVKEIEKIETVKTTNGKQYTIYVLRQSNNIYSEYRHSVEIENKNGILHFKDLMGETEKYDTAHLLTKGNTLVKVEEDEINFIISMEGFKNFLIIDKYDAIADVLMRLGIAGMDDCNYTLKKVREYATEFLTDNVAKEVITELENICRKINNLPYDDYLNRKLDELKNLRKELDELFSEYRPFKRNIIVKFARNIVVKNLTELFIAKVPLPEIKEENGTINATIDCSKAPELLKDVLKNYNTTFKLNLSMVKMMSFKIDYGEGGLCKEGYQKMEATIRKRINKAIPEY